MKQFGWVYKDGQYAKKHINQVIKEDKVYDDLGRKLIARQGNARLWHFALSKKEKKFQCDDLSYKSGKTAWHRNWQSYSPSSHLEVYKLQNSTCHIADMIDKYGNVVEIQHSNINANDIRSRENIYQNMYWIIDATKALYIILEDKSIIVKEDNSWWDYIQKPILLDIGIGLAFVQCKLFQNSHSRYYYCHFLSYYDVIVNLFVLKPDFIFIEEHLNPKLPYWYHTSNIVEKIHYRYTVFFGVWNITSSGSMDKVSHIFGFNEGKLILYTLRQFVESTNQVKIIPYITPALNDFLNSPENTELPKGRIIAISKLQIEFTPDKKCIIANAPTPKNKKKKENWQIQRTKGEIVDLVKNPLIK